MSKVLIVDDEPHIRRLVSFSLANHGYEVIEAMDGMTACTMARDERPDLILMDVMMPVMTGYEACSKLKEDPDTREIPIVMLSAKSQQAEVAHGLDSGADHFMSKPFTPRDLIAKVKEFLGDAEGKGDENG